ncbi:unnamed protein product [Prunus armeniaca]
MADLFKEDSEAPLCFQSSIPLASHSWVSKNLSCSYPSSEVRNSAERWSDWIDRLLPRRGAYWKKAGNYNAILLSKFSVNRDENLLAAALCFWNSASNTFDFRLGPMTPTLLDLAQIFGFRPHGRPADAVGDYHRGKNRERLAKPFTIPVATINQDSSFSNFLKKFSTEKDRDQQHMFVFPNCSSAVLLEYKHLTKALHNHVDVGPGPIVLAHLYKNLHSATLENPLNISAPSAFWMIQIWLQVYFPKLTFPDIVLPEDQVIAVPLMSAEVPKRSIEEYLMFFRHYTKRLFEKELEEEEAKIDFRKKFLSVTLPRDMPFSGGKPPNYHLGAEVCHLNFCARQLGCPQLIPLKSYRSCNRATSCIRTAGAQWTRLIIVWTPSIHPRSLIPAILMSLMPGGKQEPEAKKFIVQMVKGINAQVIEDPSMTRNLGRQTAQAGEGVVTSIITTGDLELPFGDEEDDYETLAKPSAEATPSARKNKRKEVTQAQDSAVQPDPLVESSPPPSKAKRLRKRAVSESEGT